MRFPARPTPIPVQDLSDRPGDNQPFGVCPGCFSVISLTVGRRDGEVVMHHAARACRWYLDRTGNQVLDFIMARAHDLA